MKKLILLPLVALLFNVTNSSAQCSTTNIPYMTCNYGDLINSFKLDGTTISANGGSCNGGYASYGTSSNPPWLIVPGATYNWSAVVGGGSWSQGFAIWIDYNNDGYFTSNEGTAYSGTSTSPSGTLTVPANATAGTVRMRIRCSYANAMSTNNMCGSHGYGWGETEQYWVEICNPPKITTQPQNSFACENGGGEFSLVASNASAGFQWQMDVGQGWINLSNGSSFEGVTTDTLKLKNTSPTLHGAMVRCIAMGCGGLAKDTSQEVSLDVHTNTKIESQTINDTSCKGIDTRLFVKSAGVITGYQWQIYSNSVGDYVDVSNAQFTNKGDTLLVVNTQDTLNGAKIRCIVKGLCGYDTTTIMQMAVNALPAVITDPQDQIKDQGETAIFEVISAGVNVKYQWQVGVNGNFSNVNNGGVYGGVYGDKLYVKGVARSQNNFQFRAIVKGTGSCAVEPDTSKQAVLLVNPALSVTGLTADENISVYPNPTSGSEVIIKIEEQNTSDITSYYVIDKLGRMMQKGTINSTNTKVNVSVLAADIYTIQFVDKNDKAVQAVRFTKL